MAEVVNLRRARKRKLREQAAKTAAENRIRHGRTLEQRRREEAARVEDRARLDLLKIERPAGD